ncbi:FAD-dependent oxidoreductase [Oceanospirillum maris]|uniref:FAD-dependent oxidoreductase n=1 Tax=Oceanospirillum maris TaxID=64977 RepID=UPI0004018397|nr:FAD-dependent oxidoreductase [Oceanospirillum maris]
MSFQIAIIGSGPSGCFLAELLSRKIPDCQIDIIERLPTLFGLVRAGVAPDHQGTKNVTRQFERTLEKDNIRVLANLTVGEEISFEALKNCYDIIIVATGAAEDNRLNIAGEDLDGVYGSSHFVGWYNANPDAHKSINTSNTKKNIQLKGSAVAVIGHGNVALDIARLLAKTPEERAATDICQPALEQMDQCVIDDIYLIGRGGPEQARFTPPELAELNELAQALPVINACAIPAEPSSEWEPREARAKQMNLDLFRQFSVNAVQAQAQRAPVTQTTGKTRIHLLFWHQPKAILGDAGRITHLELEQRLAGQAPQRVTLPIDTLISAIGYHSRPIKGLPFDDQLGRIPHKNGLTEPGVYITGWARRGPTGVIPTNRADALEMSKRILSDVESGVLTPKQAPLVSIDTLIAEKGLQVVNYSQWQQLNQAEIAAAKDQKPREKFTSTQAMLAQIFGS